MINRISTDLGLKSEVTKAIELTSDQLYPYIFVDRTPRARANKCEVFINIFGKVLVLVRGSMKFYLLAENDFKKCFDVVDCELAKYADKTKAARHSSKTSLVGSEKEEQNSDGTNSNDNNTGLESESNAGNEFTGQGARRGTTADNTDSSTDSRTKRNRGSWKAQKEYERKFKRALHKFKVNS